MIEARTGRWSWARLMSHAQRDLLLFSVAMALLSAGRIAFILIFHRHLGPQADVGSFASVLVNGMRFDARIAVMLVAPTLVISLTAARWEPGRWLACLRLGIATAFVAITLLLTAIDIGFFAEYDDQFNHFVLGAVYDDFGAVVKTVWAEHQVVLALAGWLVLSALAWWGLRRLLGSRLWPSERFAAWPTPVKVGASLALLALMVIAARGSVWKRPVQRKDIAVSTDEFLNKVVLNPYKALQYAIEDHLSLQHIAGISRFLPDGDVRAAAQRYFDDPRVLDDLDAYCQRSARGAADPPRRIFLVVMESYSAWPLMSRYRSLGLAETMRDLSDRGLGFMRFVSAGSGTMSSLCTILAGVPDADVLTNYQASSRTPFPTSLPAIFNRLGYRTRFFYAGYPSWQNIGPFARDQGFDEVYFGGDMGANWLSGKEWGVDDDRLLAFTAATADVPGPSLNVIMTVSNHPPFGLDVDAMGFPLKRVPDDLAGAWDGSVPLRVLGHFWYADRCLGAFVKTVEARDPSALIAVTGDHYGRKFINARPSLYERTAVPFVLYGPRALRGRSLPSSAAGSHLDMLPTLVELAAPSGFTYHAFGKDLLATGAPGATGLGLGRGIAITADAVVDAANPGICEGSIDDERARGLAARHRDLCALSWWRIMRGSALPPQPTPTLPQP
ncbi:MAG: LTA synthase family protein [Planctomycetes bacterium]|nr:LTA synthase family protein [Planctomycetota bacterium]